MAISNLPKLNFSVPFAMTAALPVEYNAYFDSYDAAVAAAATADVPGSSTTVYYYGQKIVVVTAESADLYIIQPDKTLKAAGTVPVGDNKSITVSDGLLVLPVLLRRPKISSPVRRLMAPSNGILPTRPPLRV